jgi:hypothetical protein
MTFWLIRILALSLLVTAVGQLRFPGRIVSGGGGGGELLTFADLSCNKVFLSPQYSASTNGSTPAFNPTTMRKISGTRHYYIIGGSSNIYTFAEPAGSTCNTALGSVAAASWPGWGGDYGSLTVHSSTEQTPGVDGNTFWTGLSYDPVTDDFIAQWKLTYVGVSYINNMARLTLTPGAAGMTLDGCNAIANHHTGQTGGGTLAIPASFVSAHLSPGQRWAVGWGGHASGDPSYGPTMFAITPPADNACATSTDYTINTATILARYMNANGGPNCELQTPLCGSTTTPTRPYAAEMAFTDYSYAMYSYTWEPHGGHGWFGFDMSFQMGWYDDRPDGGSKHGVLVPMMVPVGALVTTVSAGATPTTTSARIASVDMGDYNLNPGDVLWIKTCDIVAEPVCDGGNFRDGSIVQVATVNTGTGDITFINQGADFGSTNVPIVGGYVYGGGIYAHGAPSTSRRMVRAQIYDPADYGAVADGTLDEDLVRYAEEADWCSVIHHFGCPSAGGGIKTAFAGGNVGPAAVMPDPENRQIVVAFSHATNATGAVQHL